MSKSKGNVIDPLAPDRRAMAPTPCASRSPRWRRRAATSSSRRARRGLPQFRDQALERLALRRDERLRPRRRLRSRGGARPAQPLDPRRGGEGGRRDREAIEAFRFNDAANAAYRFVWNVFCDWHLELAKPVLQGGADGPAQGGDAGDDRPCARRRSTRCCIPSCPSSPRSSGRSRARRARRARPAGARALAASAEPRSTRRPRPRSAGSSISISEIRSVRSEMGVPPATPLPLILVTPRAIRADRGASGARRSSASRACRLVEFAEAQPRRLGADRGARRARRAAARRHRRHRRRTGAARQGDRARAQGDRQGRRQARPTPTSSRARPRRWSRKIASGARRRSSASPSSRPRRRGSRGFSPARQVRAARRRGSRRSPGDSLPSTRP